MREVGGAGEEGNKISVRWGDWGGGEKLIGVEVTRYYRISRFLYLCLSRERAWQQVLRATVHSCQEMIGFRVINQIPRLFILAISCYQAYSTASINGTIVNI